MAFKIFAAVCMLFAITGQAFAEEQPDPTAEMQKQFALAYNRGDVDAMALAFTANAVRVTPSGIFQGRDAIRQNFQDALKLGLHDYTVQRVVSRTEGAYIFNAGEWRAILRGQPFHGYYSAIVVREDGVPKIMEETVTVAAP